MFKKAKQGFTLVEIMIVVAIIGILVTIAVPGFIKARIQAQGKACNENLAKIDGAKEQYALEENKSNGDAAGFDVLVGQTLYIKKTPKCPSSGTYTEGAIGTDPGCSDADATNQLHVLP